MKGYIISVAAVSVVSAVITMITPEKWGKYVGIVTGLVVTVCIARPIINIMHADIFADFPIGVAENKTNGESLFYDKVKTGLEKRISDDAENILKGEFGKKCEVYTEAKTGVEGTVSGVAKIVVYGDKIDYTAMGRLREIYGAEEVKYGGNKKTDEKPE